MEACNITDNVVTLSQKENNILAQITLLETNGEPSAAITFEDPKGSVPIVTYTLEPSLDSLYVHFRVSVEPFNNSDNVQTLRFYDSYDLIKDLNIDYILLNRGRTVQFRRFLAESEHFTEVYEDGEIYIFKVT
jgi:hypothetical protein